MSKKIYGYAIVTYLDSCPISNFQYLLSKLPCAISPLHCRDKKDNGELKKAHYHILFPYKLTVADKRYICSITSVSHFEPIYDIERYYHYLYHWDIDKNWFIPKKAQYWSADILKNDLYDNCVETQSDFVTDVSKDYIKEILLIIKDNDLTEFEDLVDFIVCNEPCMIDFLVSKQHFFKNYIDSRRFKYKTLDKHRY